MHACETPWRTIQDEVAISSRRVLLGCVVMAAGGTSLFLAASQAVDRSVPTVQSVTVTSGSNRIEVEIAASQSVAIHSRVATHPDRLVLDFAGALPGRSLRNQAIDRGAVKGIRVGLFTQSPLVTRVVIDLKNAQPYRIYRAGKAVIVKLMIKQDQVAIGAKVDAVSYKPEAPKPQPKVDVEYKNEQLSIWADNASFADVLAKWHVRQAPISRFPQWRHRSGWRPILARCQSQTRWQRF